MSKPAKKAAKKAAAKKAPATSHAADPVFTPTKEFAAKARIS